MTGRKPDHGMKGSHNNRYHGHKRKACGAHSMCMDTCIRHLVKVSNVYLNDEKLQK